MTDELDVPETPEIGAVSAFVGDYEEARQARQIPFTPQVPFMPLEAADVEAGVTYARADKARWNMPSTPRACRAHGPFHLLPG